MKTSSNVQKTNLKAITAGLILAVLGFSVNAQGALKTDFENNPKNHMAFAGTFNIKTNAFAKSATGTETALTTFVAAETEEPMHVETWMTKTANFEATPAAFETISEEELTIENWMLDTKAFETKTSANEKAQAGQKFLVFEIANTKYIISTSTYEPPMQFENWMFVNKNWK